MIHFFEVQPFNFEPNSLYFLLLTTTESLKICHYTPIFDVMETGLYLPAQFNPFPVYPTVQTHLKLPAVL